jgi:hypothetical protein
VKTGRCSCHKWSWLEWRPSNNLRAWYEITTCWKEVRIRCRRSMIFYIIVHCIGDIVTCWVNCVDRHRLKQIENLCVQVRDDYARLSNIVEVCFKINLFRFYLFAITHRHDYLFHDTLGLVVVSLHVEGARLSRSHIYCERSFGWIESGQWLRVCN